MRFVYLFFDLLFLPFRDPPDRRLPPPKFVQNGSEIEWTREELRPASYRGVPFKVSSASVAGVPDPDPAVTIDLGKDDWKDQVRRGLG